MEEERTSFSRCYRYCSKRLLELTPWVINTYLNKNYKLGSPTHAFYPVHLSVSNTPATGYRIKERGDLGKRVKEIQKNTGGKNRPVTKHNLLMFIYIWETS